MDEFRENGRLRGALDASLSGLNGDPYLARRLIACAEKQPKAVRKRSIGLVFAFVALLAAVSVAAAAALNLFKQFGQSERRFAEIAPQTVIDSETASIQTERTGTVTASIANAYYDGESLLIGYTIQGNTSFEPFSPTAKELTHMQPTDDVPDWLHAKTGDSALAKAWENAKQAGMPWGVVRYRVSASDHTYTDEGLDLGPWTETEVCGFFSFGASAPRAGIRHSSAATRTIISRYRYETCNEIISFCAHCAQEMIGA